MDNDTSQGHYKNVQFPFHIITIEEKNKKAIEALFAKCLELLELKLLIILLYPLRRKREQ